MAVPKKKMSRSRSRRRRAVWKASVPRTALCPDCSSPHMPHRVCPNCGKYKGREVVATEE